MELFLALGRCKEAGLISIGSQELFFLPAIWILPPLYGLSGVIYAQPVADALTVLLTALFAASLHKRQKRSMRAGDKRMSKNGGNGYCPCMDRFQV
ncbi:MAG: hypothetical protein ABFC31_10220 [Clostridiaceae bacterium]